MDSRKRDARVAGALYVLMSAAAVISFNNVPTWIMEGGDAAAIAEGIAASQLSYRLGVLCDLAAQFLFALLVLALHRVLHGVSERWAAQMVALVLVQVPMGFANLLLGMAPLVLLSGADHWSALDKRELDALIMGILNWRGYGIRAIMVFWGLWLLPFGLLVLRSGFLPRILGVLLIVGCPAYLTVSVGSLLFPAYAQGLSNLLVLAAGEVLIALWLLIKGVRTEASASSHAI